MRRYLVAMLQTVAMPAPGTNTNTSPDRGGSPLPPRQRVRRSEHPPAGRPEPATASGKPAASSPQHASLVRQRDPATGEWPGERKSDGQESDGGMKRRESNRCS